jgi:hypothetical protein
MTHTDLSTRLLRHRRLLLLCGLSALAHLALLEWLAHGRARALAPTSGRAATDELVLRLLPANARRDAARGRADSRGAPGAQNAALSRPPRQAAPVRPARAAPPQAPATAAASAPSSPPAAAGAGQPEAAADSAPPVQMPGRYRVRMPETVQITYAQTRQPSLAAAGAGGGTAAATPERLPDAHIDWRSDGARYALQVDGVLGRLASQGGSGDAGVRPERASEEREGRPLVTEFVDGEVRFRARGTSVPDNTGIQDRASVLMQLAGIGLGGPEQMQGRIAVVVAGADEAAIEHYEVLGMETLGTPLGAVDAWHLAQSAAPGRARLEVWLAPERGWLPVQLRLTGTDGAVTTQSASAITTGSTGAAGTGG